MASDTEYNVSRLASDYDYVMFYANLINGKVSNPGYATEQKQFTFSGKGNLYSSINKCLSAYFNATSKLLEKISSETQTIMAMGESVKGLDTSLAKGVGGR